MKFCNSLVLFGCCTVFALMAGSAVAADDPPRPSDDADELILAEPTVPAGDLGAMSGGTDIDEVNINWAANVTNLNGNSVGDGVTTGVITNNTLSNVRGINSLMYNTGNNVSFSSNMQFNIDLQ